MEQSHLPQKTMLLERQPWDNKVKDWQLRHGGHWKILGARSTEGNEALVANLELWDKPQAAKGRSALFAWDVNIEEGDKIARCKYDVSIYRVRPLRNLKGNAEDFGNKPAVGTTTNGPTKDVTGTIIPPGTNK